MGARAISTNLSLDSNEGDASATSVPLSVADIDARIDVANERGAQEIEEQEARIRALSELVTRKEAFVQRLHIILREVESETAAIRAQELALGSPRSRVKKHSRSNSSVIV